MGHKVIDLRLVALRIDEDDHRPVGAEGIFLRLRCGPVDGTVPLGSSGIFQ